MKLSLYFLLINMLISTCFFSAVAETNETIQLKKPPASLAKWYKPENKRQVWLHTMFKLRREMQAMREYAEQEDKDHVEKWLEKFNKNYNEIAEMVPEWKDRIKPSLILELKAFVNNKDYFHAVLVLNKIGDTCDTCHKDYQPQVAALYRSPDYSAIRIKDIDGDAQNIENNMQYLSQYVNRILIALADGNNDLALSSAKDFDLQLKHLGESCQICHKNDEYPRQRILGKLLNSNMQKLQKNIISGQVKKSQKIMGDIAVTVCARCHSTHKVVSDIRTILKPELKTKIMD